MAVKHPVKIRIRTLTGDQRWIIGGTRYNVDRAHREAEALRRAGRVVHVDLAEWYH